MWFYALPSFSICVHYPFVILVVMCSCLVLLTLIFLALVCPFFITTMEPSFISRIEFFIWSASWFWCASVCQLGEELTPSVRVYLDTLSWLPYGSFTVSFLHTEVAWGIMMRRVNTAVLRPSVTCSPAPTPAISVHFTRSFFFFSGEGGLLFPSWQLTTMRTVSLYT